MPPTTLRRGQRSLNLAKCDNAGLALERYLALQDDPAAKEKLFEAVSERSVSDIYVSAYTRWKKTLDATPDCTIVEAKVGSRMIIGLGAESVLETAITLHRVYGVPVIPGSALKGMCRHYFSNSVEESADRAEHVKILFGDTTSQGFITFLPAWYVPGSAIGNKPLKRDVLTVHHQNYYTSRGNAAPSDFDDPIPVGFISATGEYLIAIQGPNPEWTNYALDLLKRALAEYGVGGKTSSGYGRLFDSTLSNHTTTSRSNVTGAFGQDRPPFHAVAKLRKSLQQLKLNEIKSKLDGCGNQWLNLPSDTTQDEKAELREMLIQHLRAAGLEAEWKKNHPWVMKLG